MIGLKGYTLTLSWKAELVQTILNLRLSPAA